MTNAFRSLRPVFLAAVVALAAACASTSSAGSARFGPGDVVEFGGTSYRMLQVDQDFVLMRHRDPIGEAGGISGYVDEVFRVSRYRLGEGRWTDPEKAPGVALRWLGLESFALQRDDGPPVVAAETGGEVVQVEPEAEGK